MDCCEVYPTLKGVGPVENGGAVLADAPFRVVRVVQSRAGFAGASKRIGEGYRACPRPWERGRPAGKDALARGSPSP